MCSVVGYIGRSFCRSLILKGLTRLQYRGYDSAGFACLSPQDNTLLAVKAEGELSNLKAECIKNPIDGYIGIGHTRWSTHGSSSVENAHPHFDCTRSLAIVHNGIIENYHQLKEEIAINGIHQLTSQTDTELIAHLLEEELEKTSDLKEATQSVVARLKGAFAFICVLKEHPDTMIVVRKGSPLCIGIGKDEMVVASDVFAFAGFTEKVVYLPDNSFALVQKNQFKLFSFAGEYLPSTEQRVSIAQAHDDKGGHNHFMLKEIYEQKAAIHTTASFFQQHAATMLEQLGVTVEQIKNLESVTIVGCGSSWHAARIAQFFFESVALLPTSVCLASEFRYMPFFPKKNGLYIFVSQSGETADTLEALRMVRTLNVPTIALTNVASSTMVREADGFLLTHAGPEIAVASTKAFTTQLVSLYWFAHKCAFLKGLIPRKTMEQSFFDISIAAEMLENSIEKYKAEIVTKLAPYYAQFKKFVFLGRHISYPFALEAALKLKEISYLFAQCYPAGELKHGPLALVDAETPVFLFSSLDPLIYQKLVSNAQEIKARKGHLIVFAYEGQDELADIASVAFILPHVSPLLAPLAATGLMQFFVYQIAVVLNCPIDKPRNLAKSVTVE